MSAADHPPELPEIIDEAGDTPSWVPLLGLAIFALVVAYIWWSHRQHEALEQGGSPAAEQHAEP